MPSSGQKKCQNSTQRNGDYFSRQQLAEFITYTGNWVTDIVAWEAFNMALRSNNIEHQDRRGVPGPADCACITVGITGHRNLDYVEIDELRMRVRQFFLNLQTGFPDLAIKLLNPLAEGSDRLVAEVAIELGIAMISPLPMPVTEYEKDFTNDESVARFRALCEQAEVSELPLAEGNTLESIASDPTARAKQYAQLGIFISSHSQILLALWDGEPGLEIGGTGSVVFFHQHEYMPGYLEPEATAQLLADNENDLVYHIWVPRKPLSSEDCERTDAWLGHQSIKRSSELPAAYRVMFENLQTFLRDAVRHRASLQQSLRDLRQKRANPLTGELDTIEQLFVYADGLALHYRKRVLLGFRVTHTVAVLLGLCFILFSEYEALSFLLPVFLLLFASAYVLNSLMGARQWHRKYLDYRALAEGLRVQYYWILGGVEKQRHTVFAYDNLLQKQDVELVWIRHIMRNAMVLRMQPGERSDEHLQVAIDEWVGDKNHEGGQWNYYLRAASTRQQQFRNTTFITMSCLWLGICIAVSLALIGQRLSDQLFQLLLVFMGVLPLIAGVRKAYAFKNADQELVKQYRFMAQLFGRARQRLSEAGDSQTRRNLLLALGEACLEEHAEWLLTHRGKSVV